MHLHQNYQVSQATKTASATDDAVCLRSMVDEPRLEPRQTMTDRNMHVNKTYARTQPAEWHLHYTLRVPTELGTGRLLFSFRFT